jgi:hypothetical protein
LQALCMYYNSIVEIAAEGEEEEEEEGGEE